jgi:hypothetical protein
MYGASALVANSLLDALHSAALTDFNYSDKPELDTFLPLHDVTWLPCLGHAKPEQTAVLI